MLFIYVLLHHITIKTISQVEKYIHMRITLLNSKFGKVIIKLERVSTIEKYLPLTGHHSMAV